MRGVVGNTQRVKIHQPFTCIFHGRNSKQSEWGTCVEVEAEVKKSRGLRGCLPLLALSFACLLPSLLSLHRHAFPAPHTCALISSYTVTDPHHSPVWLLTNVGPHGQSDWEFGPCHRFHSWVRKLSQQSSHSATVHPSPAGLHHHTA